MCCNSSFPTGGIGLAGVGGVIVAAGAGGVTIAAAHACITRANFYINEKQQLLNCIIYDTFPTLPSSSTGVLSRVLG